MTVVTAGSRDVLVKSNDLIMASFRISLTGQVIIHIALSKLDRGATITDDALYRITSAEYAQLLSIKPHDAYRNLVRATRELQKEIVYLPSTAKLKPGSKRGGVNDDRSLSWVQESVPFTSNHEGEYESGVDIRFGKAIAAHLSLLRENFTSLPFTKLHLPTLLKLKNIYAMRFYEIFYSQKFRKDNSITLTIEEIRSMFALGKKYPQTGSFKKKVIDAAIDEINDKLSDINVSYTTERKGRRVYAYKFEYAFLEKDSPIKDGRPSENNLKFETDRRSTKISKALNVSVASIREAYKGVISVADKRFDKDESKRYVEILDALDVYLLSRCQFTGCGFAEAVQELVGA